MLRRWRRRDRSSPGAETIACIDFVELITDYLDGAVPAERVEVIDAHLEVCPGCHEALEEFRTVIQLTGRLAEDDVDALTPDVRAGLMVAFAQAHPGG